MAGERKGLTVKIRFRRVEEKRYLSNVSGFIQWRIVAGLFVLEKVLVTVLLGCPSKESSLCTVLKTCHVALLSCLLFPEANIFICSFF